MALTPSDDGHLIGAAPEDELIRLDRAYRDLEAKARRASHMRPVVVHQPPAEAELTTGDLP
jgi:hypothetical protein